MSSLPDVGFSKVIRAEVVRERVERERKRERGRERVSKRKRESA